MQCCLTDNKAVFDAIAHQYRAEDQHWGANLEAIKTVLTITDDPPVWVDAGCGPGHHIEAVLKDGRRSFNEVVGIDYSEAMIQEAKSRLAQYDNVTLTQCNVTRPACLPTATTVTCLNNTFGNILLDGDGAKARQAFLKHMADALQPSGSFLLSVYNLNCVSDTYGDNLSIVKANHEAGDFVIEYDVGDKTVKYYSHWFTKDEIQSLFANHDIAVTSIEEDGVRLLIKGRKP